MTDGLAIGQAAAFAGVTVKTVRHYHRLGLVKEPERDSSGYRRYGWRRSTNVRGSSLSLLRRIMAPRDLRKHGARSSLLR